ncbi:MAG: hypothetical protein AB1454_06130 [Candidatus Auribacterota bacterium]
MDKNISFFNAKKIFFIILFLLPISAYIQTYFLKGNVIIYGDGLLEHFPTRYLIQKAYSSNNTPQWNPYISSGHSIHAESQNGLCFPATQIIYRFFPPKFGWFIEILSYVLTAFIACFFFLKHHIKDNIIPSLLGASIYAFCCYVLRETWVPSIMWNYALYPLFFLAIDLYWENKRFSGIFLLILISCLILSGHPPSMIYEAMMITVYWLIKFGESLKNNTVKTSLKKGVVDIALISLVAIIISLPHILPMIELFPISPRREPIPLDIGQNQLHIRPHWFLYTLFPIPLNEESPLDTLTYPIFAIFLAGMGVFFQKKDYKYTYFLFSLIFTLLMALGPYVNLWKLVHALPLLRNFRRPLMWLFFLPISISFFSAHGLKFIFQKKISRLSSKSLFLSIICLLTLFLLGGLALKIIKPELLGFLTEKISPKFLYLFNSSWCYASLLLVSFFMMIVGILFCFSVTSRWGVFLGILGMLLNLYGTIVFKSTDPALTFDINSVIQRENIHQYNPDFNKQLYRIYVSGFGWDWPGTLNTFPYGGNELIKPYVPNINTFCDILGTNGKISFLPYWAGDIPAFCAEYIKGNKSKEIYFDISSTRLIFHHEPISGEKFKLIKTEIDNTTIHYSPWLKPSEKVYIYSNETALPRMCFIPNVKSFSTEKTLLEYLESAKYKPLSEALILTNDTGKTDSISADEPKTTDITFSITKDLPGVIEISLFEPASGNTFFLLNDTYYPGWKAKTNGTDTQIYRTNYAYRGIFVPKGTENIIFYFDPKIKDIFLIVPTIILFLLALIPITAGCWKRRQRCA